MLPQTFGSPMPGAGGLQQMLQAASAQQMLGTHLALMEQQRKYEQSQANNPAMHMLHHLQESQAMLTQATLAVMAQQQEQQVNMEPALIPPPGLPASAPLLTGMTLRLAANGVSVPQNVHRSNEPQMVGRRGRPSMPKREHKEFMQTGADSMLQPRDKEHNSLRNFLEEDLQNVDKRCVFTARRINKLGFKSKEFLHKHFSKYGEVVEVFVTHPRSKPEFPGAPPKMRPGNFGIVVMKSPEDVQRILALGSEQMVKQILIRVNIFEAKADESSGSGGGKDGSSSNTGTTTASSQWGSISQGDAGSGGDNPNDENDSDESQRGMSQMGEDTSTQVETGMSNALSRDPQKVAIHTGTNADPRMQRLLRKEAQRLRAEADAILAVAEQAAALPTSTSPSDVTAAVASMLDSEGFVSHGYPQAPMPPLPPCDWMKTPTKAASPPASEAVSPDSHCTGTLSSHLMEVSAEDPACVFVARQLHRLGFQSREKLRQHFSQYGKVLRVLVADKRVKAFPGVNTQRKTRPGGLGLILMKNAASVRKILSDGQEQYVYGQKVLIQPYEGPKTNTLVIDEAAFASGGHESPEGNEGKAASATEFATEPVRLHW